MRRPNQPMPGLEGLLPYALIAGFAIAFWGVTMLMWGATFPPEIYRDGTAPNVLWASLAFLLPLMGYGALIRANPTPDTGFNPATYVGMQIFALIVWILSVWLWSTAYLWSTAVTDSSFILVVVLQLLPYWFWVRSTTTPQARPASARPLSILDTESWLGWLGKGEPQRGAMILLVAIFWSILFWQWQNLTFWLAFPIWGLLTITMMVIIRLFSRRAGPSGEVSAASDPKSKATSK